tara:strand:+ start:1384 stop:3489 length:2106 start_codon:yes stop_codon:yes gene_type:complete
MMPPSPLVAAPHLKNWLKLSEGKKLIFFTGRVELGQGNTTALLMMIADELDVLPSSIILETARTDLTPNEGITAGSMSITIGGQALRWVASALKMQLLEIASKRLRVHSKDLSIYRGYIFNKGKKTERSVTDFFDGLDLTSKIVDDAKPKTFGERRKSFRDINRIDLESRLFGAPFIQDLKFDDMVYGASVHPPSTHSYLVNLDLEMLKGRPGVIKVVRNGSFVGIIASTFFHAKNAASWARNNGKWESNIKEPFNLFESLKNLDSEPETVIESRDVNKNSGTWFEITASRPFIYHGSIGPATAVAKAEKDKITIFTHSQGVFQLRQAIAKVLNTAEEKICVIHKPGSGCYGHNGADDVAFDAVLMAKSVPGRFIKVVWSRFDEFHSSPMGASMVTKSRALLSSNNRLVAFDVELNSTPHTNRPSANFPNLRAAGYLANPISPSRTPDVPVERGGGADRNAIPSYEVGGVRVRKRIIYDTPYRTSALRSLGAYCNVIANEALLDSIAKQIEVEPIAFRLDHTTDPRAREILERLDYETKKDRALSNEEGIGWGIGFARYKGSGGYCAVMVKVHVGENVSVTDAISVSDVGEAVSSDGVKNQVEGGIIQSISWTLKECVPVDGFSATAESWTDYPILKFSEIPNLRTILIDRPEEKPLGAGEISQGPTGAAIVNAVADAIGCHVTNLPITRDAIIGTINAQD